MKDRHLTRRDKLRRAVKKAGVDGLLVTDFVNVSYLTGFTGEDSYLLVRRDGDVMLSDSRYTTQLSEECLGLDVETRTQATNMLDMLGKAVRSSRIGRLGIEGNSMTVTNRDRIAESMPKTELAASSGLVEELRQIKDKQEIGAIRRSIRCAEKAFGVLKATLRPEKSERQIRDELEYQMRLFGAEDRGFPTIVAVGPRAALPHATVTDRRVESADFVLVDWGAKAGLYVSDLTRVLVTGKISPKLERIYGVVLNAQRQAIAAIRPGVRCDEVDAIARKVIADAGFGRYFGHGLGHGIGLVVHEWPRFSSICQTLLKPGMVLTVEPGIYLPGWGGVRIEDDVLVTRDGHEVLSSVPKELEEAVVVG